jgi:hypothetical protein
MDEKTLKDATKSYVAADISTGSSFVRTPLILAEGSINALLEDRTFSNFLP